MEIKQNVARLVGMLVSPVDTLGEIKLNPSWLFPLLLLSAATASQLGAFFATVDSERYVDHIVATIIEQSDADVPERAERRIRDQVASTPLQVQAGVSVAAAFVFGVLVTLIIAGYLKLISALADVSLSFRQWFSLSCWCGIPILLSVLASLVNLALSGDAIVAVNQLNPLAPANLLDLDLSAIGPLLKILLQLDPALIWATLLMVVGYRAWTSCSLVTSALVVIAPYALLTGIALWIAG